MKIETYELTDKEATLAQCADIKFEYFYEETGYSNCDGDSSFLCFTLREALKTTDFDKHQIAGIIGSLEKKVFYILNIEIQFMKAQTCFTCQKILLMQ